MNRDVVPHSTMPAGLGQITGPAMDEIVAEATEWYKSERKFMIDAMLAGGYPYGATPLTEAEQVQRFQSMTDADWASLRATLMNIFKGDADAAQATDKAVSAYTRQMQQLSRIMRNPIPLPEVVS